MPPSTTTSTTAQKQPQQPERITPAEAARRLQSINWERYWQSVAKNSAEDIATYRQARARYLEMASHRVLV